MITSMVGWVIAGTRGSSLGCWWSERAWSCWGLTFRHLTWVFGSLRVLSTAKRSIRLVMIKPTSSYTRFLRPLHPLPLTLWSTATTLISALQKLLIRIVLITRLRPIISDLLVLSALRMFNLHIILFEEGIHPSRGVFGKGLEGRSL